MLVYLFLFAICIIVAYFAEKFVDNKIFFFLLSLVLVVLPSIVAAFRFESVGTDVMVYEYRTFVTAKFSSSFTELCDNIEVELFFCFINYIAAKVSDSIAVAFFLIEFTMLFFAWLAMYRLRKKASFFLMYSTFLLGFFNISLNLMRQCVAIGFLLFAVSYLIENKSYTKYFILILVSFFFHKTAPIVGLAIMIASYISDISEDRKRNVWIMLYISGCVVVSMLFVQLLEMLSILGGRFEHYVAYGGQSGSAFTPMFYSILCFGDFVCLALCRFLYKNSIVERGVLYFYLLVITFDTMAQLLGRYTAFATRIGMYTCALQPIFMGIFVRSPKISSRSKIIIKLAIFVVFLIIWFRLVNGTGHTVPYLTKFF